MWRRTVRTLQADRYDTKIDKVLSTLSSSYHAWPECRHLATKSRMYRNIILDAHLIIYRITTDCIEVLDIVHAASSVRKIRAVRGIRPQ
ncbi:MAG: type II toxin-antitoxin system RelE/ParE family toxin [Bacteroidales bacterium]|nr:type II toxin-antitoxin system RelE/ParE family toxin [Bacteroidales bacterium]